MSESATETPAFRLPSKQSFSPSPLGHGASIFQFDTKQLRDDVNVTTLIGAVASASGAPLANREFDTISILAKWYFDGLETAERQARREALRAGATPEEAMRAGERARDEAAENQWIESTMHQLSTTIYGGKSRERYRALSIALENLARVTVSLPGFDAQTQKLDPHALSMVHLISAIVVTDKQREIAWARENSEEGALARVTGSAKGQVTLKVKLDEWVVTAIRRGSGQHLNFRVQRALSGHAKSLWIQLEALAFTQVADDVEQYVLPLTAETFASLGINSTRQADKLRKVRDRLDAILAEDPAYLDYEVLRDPDDRRRASAIVVRRCTGEMLQRRLRAQAKDRLPSEQPQLEMVMGEAA